MPCANSWNGRDLLAPHLMFLSLGQLNSCRVNHSQAQGESLICNVSDAALWAPLYREVVVRRRFTQPTNAAHEPE